MTKLIIGLLIGIAFGNIAEGLADDYFQKFQRESNQRRLERDVDQLKQDRMEETYGTRQPRNPC